jgi:cysteine-rich repeat protein
MTGCISVVLLASCSRSSLGIEAERATGGSDAGNEGGAGAGDEASPDAGEEAGPDTSEEAGPDAGEEGGPDVCNASASGGVCMAPEAAAPTCNASNCTGCCQGDLCLPGTKPTACGLGGATCKDCTMASEGCFASTGTCGVGCGNGYRDGLEGCDDGNTVSGDGCRSDCVVEGAKLPVLYDFLGSGIGIYAIAGTPSGLLYLQDFNNPQVHRLDLKGTLTQNVVPGIRSGFYPSASLVAVGEDLVVGGEVQIGSARYSDIYGWHAQSGTTTTLYSELTPTALISHTATDLGLTQTVYSDQMGFLRRVTGAGTSVAYGPSYAQAFRVVRGPSGLVVLVKGATFSEIEVDDGTGNLSVLYKYMPTAGESWWDIAIDKEGTFYMTCIGAPGGVNGPCPSGAVWAVNATGSQAQPFVDNFASIFALTWDPGANALALVVSRGDSVLEPKIVLVPLAR